MDQAAANLTPSGSLNLLLALAQAGGLLLVIQQLSRMQPQQQVGSLAISLAVSLIMLLITPFLPGWLLIIIPTSLAFLAGRSNQSLVRWSARLLWVCGGAGAAILGGVGVAAIIGAGLSAWLCGYIARQLSPFEAASLDGEPAHKAPGQSLA